MKSGLLSIAPRSTSRSVSPGEALLHGIPYHGGARRCRHRDPLRSVSIVWWILRLEVGSVFGLECEREPFGGVFARPVMGVAGGCSRVGVAHPFLEFTVALSGCASMCAECVAEVVEPQR